MSLRRLQIILGIILVALVLWVGISYYIFSRATELVHATGQSKDYNYGISYSQEFVTNQAGEKIEILTVPNTNTKEIILYFHGNWGRIPYVLRDASVYGTVVSPAYPGYSMSEGSPTSDNVYETVDLTMQYLLDKGYSLDQITVLGHSLGGSPSMYAASKYPTLKKVIIVNTFYSIEAMCQKDYSIFCIFSKDYLPTARLAQNANAKIRHFHTPNDELIPFEQGKQLFEKIKSEDKKFYSISGTHGEFDVAFVLTNE